jgi:hypothetical protein
MKLNANQILGSTISFLLLTIVFFIFGVAISPVIRDDVDFVNKSEKRCDCSCAFNKDSR